MVKYAPLRVLKCFLSPTSLNSHLGRLRLGLAADSLTGRRLRFKIQNRVVSESSSNSQPIHQYFYPVRSQIRILRTVRKRYTTIRRRRRMTKLPQSSECTRERASLYNKMSLNAERCAERDARTQTGRSHKHPRSTRRHVPLEATFFSFI